MARWRLVLALGLAAATLTIVGGASAINVPSVPNGSFEQGPPCGAFPITNICGWNDLVGTMSQDGTLHHTGSFSMKVTNASGTSVEATTANGVCITPITPGPHWVGFWYYTSAPVVDVQFGASWYPNATCSTATFGSSALHATTPITYGAWTQVTGTVTAPATTGSAFFSFFASCQCTGPTPITANFDDVGFSSTSAVTLRSFAAVRSPAGVRVRWRTGSEADTLGFHVFRSRGSRWTRADARLIPAKGSVSGARYSFLDSRAPHGRLTYRLRVVSRDGATAWFGRALNVHN